MNSGMSTQRTTAFGLFILYFASVKGDCPAPPVIPHSTHNGSSAEVFNENDVIAYQCHPGFGRLGPHRYVCRHGNWIGGSPVCERLACADPHIDRLILTGSDWSVGNSVTASCPRGYRLLGPARLVCLVNQHWSPAPPRCRVVTCDEIPHLADGERFQDTLLHGRNVYLSVVENSCRPGFQLRGSELQTCLANGTWSGEQAVCEEVSCGWPDIGLGILVTLFGTRLGDSGIIHCSEETTFIGEPTGLIFCTDNGWTDGYCYANCEIGYIEDGWALTETLNHADILVWSCNPGYVKSPPSVKVTCYNGTLTSSPSCVPVSFDNADGCRTIYEGDQRTRHGDKCYYFLQNSYTTKGSAMEACWEMYRSGLVTVPDQSAMDFLQAAMLAGGWRNKDVWLGIKWEDEQWKLDNGVSLPYSNWQPDEGGSTLLIGKLKTCAVMECGTNWQWNDVYCVHVDLPFIDDSRHVICEGHAS